MLQKLRNDEKGFTLIELMIVVAIIGILAAIAVPQFRTYRIRASNTKSVTTVKKTIAVLAALNSDIGCYGITATGANLNSVAGNTGASRGAILRGSAAATATIAGGHITGTNGDGVTSGVGLSVPSDVDLGVSVSGRNLSYVIVSEAVNGNRAFGVDSDMEDNTYFVQNYDWVGLDGDYEETNAETGEPTGVIVNSFKCTHPEITKDVNNFAGENGGGSPTQNWALLR